MNHTHLLISIDCNSINLINSKFFLLTGCLLVMQYADLSANAIAEQLCLIDHEFLQALTTKEICMTKVSSSFSLRAFFGSPRDVSGLIFVLILVVVQVI